MYKQNRNSENNFLDEILVYGRQTQSNEDKRDSDNSLILVQFSHFSTRVRRNR
jgi:hypothetical protein